VTFARVSGGEGGKAEPQSWSQGAQFRVRPGELAQVARDDLAPWRAWL
jgi:hypothetical protein